MKLNFYTTPSLDNVNLRKQVVGDDELVFADLKVVGVVKAAVLAPWVWPDAEAFPGVFWRGTSIYNGAIHKLVMGIVHHSAFMRLTARGNKKVPLDALYLNSFTPQNGALATLELRAVVKDPEDGLLEWFAEQIRDEFKVTFETQPGLFDDEEKDEESAE